MQQKTFWLLVIKIFGLWLLSKPLTLIPLPLSALLFDDFLSSSGFSVPSLILEIAFFGILGYLLIFKAEKVLEVLKLSSGIPEEQLNFSHSSQSILRIAILVFGSFLVIESLPHFLMYANKYIMALVNEIPNNDLSALLFYFVRLIFGVVLLMNSHPLSTFLDKSKNQQ